VGELSEPASKGINPSPTTAVTFLTHSVPIFFDQALYMWLVNRIPKELYRFKIMTVII
jgi:hypothetical protein